MCNLNECLEHTVSIKWSYPRSSAVAPIIEVSKVREAKNTTKSLKSLNSVITVLLQTIEKEVLIPILKTKTEKQLAQEIGERFDKFYELRRSLIAAFLSNFQDKDLERLLLLIKSKAEQHIDSFLETKASSIIGEDATLSIIFALDTNRKVNKSFLNLLKQDVVNEQWFEDKSKELYKLEFAKTFLDLCLCSLFLSFRNEVPFKVKGNTLRTLAFICKNMATLIYAYAKELKIIKFPKLEVKQLIEIESDADDMLLAEAGLRDYVALLKKEEAHG